jgi:hypothetical protein
MAILLDSSGNFWVFCNAGSIQNILKLAEQLSITWPLPEAWDNQTLALKFYPPFGCLVFT